MDRAARAVRRSSVKLMSLGGGHTDLHVLLSEVKDMRQAAKAFMNAQNTVSQDFLKWAANEDNRALQDVANQLAELNLLWTEVQREFGEHIKDYRHMFEMILEGEKHVSQSRNHFAVCEQREMKIRKELKKAFKKSSTAEIQYLETKLAQSERAKHLAQLEVTDRVRENEAVKLIRVKEGLMKMTEAYSDFTRKCSVVFDAQQDIVQELPDVLDQDLEDLKYTGTGVTRHCVQQAKEKVRNYRTRKDYSHIPHKYSEPPPPYSLTNDLDFVDPASNPSILSAPVLHASSPRRRISTAITTTNITTDNNYDSSNQQQRDDSDNGNINNNNNNSISQNQYYNLVHQSPPAQAVLPPPPPPIPEGYDPLYPRLPYSSKTSCYKVNLSPSSNGSSSSSKLNNTTNATTICPPTGSSAEVNKPTPPPLPPPPPHHHHHHSSFVNTNNTPTPASVSHKVVAVAVPPPPSPQPQPQPPQSMEAAVPEVPADLRPVMSKPPSYDDDCNIDEDDGDVGIAIDISSATIAAKDAQRKGGLSCGGNINAIVQEAVVGLVDFNPQWDDSYEEDLSGAMGGAKI